jgi:hypothetical protein
MIKEAEIATIKKFMILLDIIMMSPEAFKSDSPLVSQCAKKGKSCCGLIEAERSMDQCCTVATFILMGDRRSLCSTSKALDLA